MILTCRFFVLCFYFLLMVGFYSETEFMSSFGTIRIYHIKLSVDFYKQWEQEQASYSQRRIGHFYMHAVFICSRLRGDTDICS